MHLQAGQALAAAGTPVERAAQHLLAGTTLDARTPEWLVASVLGVVSCLLPRIPRRPRRPHGTDEPGRA
jgi:hypothetical protein